MANREACELYIEQEIKDSLAAGKKPWTIGKELSKWVEKLFEVTINPKTIASRATRVSSSEEKKSHPTETITNSTPSIIENRKSQGGGQREGAGRPKKEPPIEIPLYASDAMKYVQMAISQLDKILPNDPGKIEALNQVIEYCNARKENE
jgi:hypothetical protein